MNARIYWSTGSVASVNIAIVSGRVVMFELASSVPSPMTRQAKETGVDNTQKF